MASTEILQAQQIAADLKSLQLHSKDANFFFAVQAGWLLGWQMMAGRSAHHFGPHLNISTTIGCIAMTFLEKVG